MAYRKLEEVILFEKIERLKHFVSSHAFFLGIRFEIHVARQ